VPERTAATNLLGGTITRYVALSVNIGIGIFLMPFTVNHLGKPQYGLWMLVASITSYFTLLDLGYDSGLVRHIVAADTHRDEDRVNRIISTFFCVYAGIGLVVLAVTAFVARFGIPRFPHLAASDIGTARAVLAILGIRVAIGFPMTVFGAIATSRQAFVRNNCIDVVLALTTAVVTYVVLTAGGGLVALVLATTLVALGGYLAYLQTARSVFPGLTIAPRLFSRALWREITMLSVYLFVIDMAFQVAFNIDNLVIGAFLGTSAIAIYAVALRLSVFQRRLCDQFSGMLFPVAVGISGANDRAGLATALIEGARVGVVLVVGVTICLANYAGPLVRAWMGPGFDGSVQPLYVLAIAGLVLVGNASQHSILVATGRHRLVAWVWVAEAIANLVLSLVWVRRYGTVGVALGTAVPIAVGHLAFITPAACRQAGVTLGRFVRATLGPAVIGAVPTIVICAALRRDGLPTRGTNLILEAAAVGISYLAIVIVFGLNSETRRRYARQVALLRTFLRRRSAPTIGVPIANG
jgi:O-antigen/teichoic acid export membrane protein